MNIYERFLFPSGLLGAIEVLYDSLYATFAKRIF